MKYNLLCVLLMGGSVLQGMEKPISPVDKPINSKKRKGKDIPLAESTSVVVKTDSLLLNLPDALKQCILDFLSTGIHSWEMWDNSRYAHEVAVSSWCNFSLVSKTFKNNAHCWAEQRFKISKSDYELFKHVQRMRSCAFNLINKAYKNGEISNFHYFGVIRPYTLYDQTKKGLLLEGGGYVPVDIGYRVVTVLRYPELCTPWGKISLFPFSINADTQEIEISLIQRFKLVYDQENVEQAESYENYKSNERYKYTEAATKIIWNIFLARYAKEVSK